MADKSLVRHGFMHFLVVRINDLVCTGFVKSYFGFFVEVSFKRV